MSGASSWNTSGFASAPNSNTMDASRMPSKEAQAAREKTAAIMAALKAGDGARADALMGKDQTSGKVMPGAGWLKRKLNQKHPNSIEIVGEEVEKDGLIKFEKGAKEKQAAIR